jgi:hypothetical protein
VVNDVFGAEIWAGNFNIYVIMCLFNIYVSELMTVSQISIVDYCQEFNCATDVLGGSKIFVS